MLLEHLIDTNNIEIEKDQLNFINGLIRGDRRTDYNQDWIYEVVSSKKTGLDMDRFDYMRRDPLHLGQQDLVFHPQIYLDNFQIVEGNIAFSSKIAPRLYEFFHHRYRLFKNLYSNKKAHGYDYLLADLLLLAKGEGYKFDEIIFDPAQYINLTNNIFHQLSCSENEDIKKLINRFYSRDHYRACGDSISFKLSSKKRHSKEELKKFHKIILDLQKREDFKPNLTPQSTPKKDRRSKDLILTENNSFLSTSLVKFSKEEQFETLKVFDRSQKEKGLISLCEIQHLGNVGEFKYEYSLDLYVKDKDLLVGATRSWNRFKEVCGEQVAQLAK